MKDTRLKRVITAFTRDYHKSCVEGNVELRVSQLSPEEQAEFWRRDDELHPSGFPYCGLRDAYERYIRDDDPVINQNYGSDYYLNAGTVMHTAFQHWFGRSGRLVGTWKCTKCSNTRAFGTRPARCKCGNTEFKYDELGAKEGKLSWHTDGIYMFGPRDQPEYWLLDLKSTSMYALEKWQRGENTELPYKKNVFQVESYTRLVEKKYGIKIAGWLLVYVPRDKPNQSWRIGVFGKELTDERREQLDTRLAQAVRDFGHARHARTHPIKVFKNVIPSKLCCDREFYNEFIASPFDECPLAKDCFNRKRLIAKIKETVES